MLLNRSHFPFFFVHPDLIYADNGATTQRLDKAIDAEINFYQQMNAPVHRGVYAIAEKATDLLEQARADVASFINASSPQEIVFTRGSTEGVNTVAYAWARHNLKAGDRIVVSQLEHHANCVPWIECARQLGLELVWIPIDAKGHLILDDLDTLIAPHTKLVALTLSSNVIGNKVPYDKVFARAKAVGAATLADAAQAIAHTKIDVQKIDCDFLVFSAHKMYGPTGIGGLYINKRRHEELVPFQVGGGMIELVTSTTVTYQKMPSLLEAGTPAIAQIISLGATVRTLMNEVDYAALAVQEHALAKRMIDGLARFPLVKIVGDADDIAQHGHLVSFHVEGIHAHDVAAYCGSKDICMRAGRHCAQPLHDALGIDATVRASFALYNTPEEIEKILTVLAELLS